LAICLVWISAVTFAANSHDTAMKPTEALYAEHSADGISAVSETHGGLWDRVLARAWTAHDQLHGALAQSMQGLQGEDGIGWGLVLAIGLRPCSGAVLVLILASAMGLTWYGALAVLAMSLGTALTIVLLAILATRAREWASRIVAHQSPLWALAGGGVGALGGILLVLLGLVLLSASFTARQTMGL
jgi:ABC-type nickel/cobalt efflux system permease component RcnA